MYYLGCFCATRAELINCDRDSKSINIYCDSLEKKFFKPLFIQMKIIKFKLFWDDVIGAILQKKT